MMLIEASWPSNSDAVVTKRTLLASCGVAGAGAASVAARYVEVRVTDPKGDELRLGGYRSNY